MVVRDRFDCVSILHEKMVAIDRFDCVWTLDEKMVTGDMFDSVSILDEKGGRYRQIWLCRDLDGRVVSIDRFDCALACLQIMAQVSEPWVDWLIGHVYRPLA